MIKVEKLADVPKELLSTHTVVCIDEGQFFSDLYEQVNYMVDELGLDVFVAGLNGDSNRKKFGHILDLLPDVDDVRVLRDTLCIKCASRGETKPALFTWKLLETGKQVEIGAANYIPVCRGC
jgi:thymidine kinase